MRQSGSETYRKTDKETATQNECNENVTDTTASKHVQVLKI